MLFGCLNESGWTEIFPNIDPTSLVYGPCCQKWVRLQDAHKLNGVFEAFIPSPSVTRFSDFIIFWFILASHWKITLMIMRSLIREFRGPKLSQIWSKTYHRSPTHIKHTRRPYYCKDIQDSCPKISFLNRKSNVYIYFLIK